MPSFMDKFKVEAESHLKTKPKAKASTGESLDEFLARFRLTEEQYRTMSKAMPYEELVCCLELLRPSKHKTAYREKLEKKIRGWVQLIGIGKPLTSAEFKAAAPKWPIKYQLPK
ncbi:hypothetical protein [Burkholderia phage BCSR5]|nr:hypothetical protein [Burkholderia phage BCSR5]